MGRATRNSGTSRQTSPSPKVISFQCTSICAVVLGQARSNPQQHGLAIANGVLLAASPICTGAVAWLRKSIVEEAGPLPRVFCCFAGCTQSKLLLQLCSESLEWAIAKGISVLLAASLSTLMLWLPQTPQSQGGPLREVVALVSVCTVVLSGAVGFQERGSGGVQGAGH